VRAGFAGGLPSGVHLRKVRIDPERVEVEGPQHLVDRLNNVRTEEIDLSGISQNTLLERKLLPPAPQVKVLRDEGVRIRVIISGE